MICINICFNQFLIIFWLNSKLCFSVTFYLDIYNLERIFNIGFEWRPNRVWNEFLNKSRVTDESSLQTHKWSLYLRWIINWIMIISTWNGDPFIRVCSECLDKSVTVTLKQWFLPGFDRTPGFWRQEILSNKSKKKNSRHKF